MRLPLITAALSCLSLPLAAQQPTPLRPGVAVRGSLAAGDTARFSLSLRDSVFLLGTVDQPDQPLAVRVVGPSRGQRVRVENPGTGALRFSAIAVDSGVHEIQVIAPSGKAAAYTLTLLRQEPLSREPARRADQLLARYDDPSTPGGVVRVWRNGRVLYTKGFGVANLTYAIPYRTDTPTNLGSTSKQFTAFAVLLQVDRGLVSLDDDIRKHIPEIPYLGDTVRVRHLLTHLSGIREFLNLLSMTERRVGEDWIERAELIEIVQRQPKLQNVPGAEYNYNNTAFGLAAVIVERTSGKAFPTFLRDEVFVPLGMTRTVSRADRATIVPNGAPGYTPRASGYGEATDLAGALGAGGIYTTVEDLQRWGDNMMSPTPKVGTRAIFDLMMTSASLNDGRPTRYGMGLSVDEQRGVKRVHHGGADNAHRSMLALYPTLNAGVSVQSNNANFNSSVAFDIASIFFNDAMTQASATATVAQTPAAASPPPPATPAFAPTGTALQAFVGRYWSEELDSHMTIEQRGDSLVLRQRRQADAALRPASSTDSFQGRSLTLSFERNRNGEVIGFYAANGRTRDVRFARLRP